jgi:tetratricopeptide (TPR) repeat protein
VAALAGEGLTTGEHALAPQLASVEQRVTSTILVSAAAPVNAQCAAIATPDLAPAAHALDQDTLAEIRAVVAPFGGRAERSLASSVAVTLAGHGAPAEVAAQAARCALLLRARFPRACLAVGTGRVLVETAGDPVVATAHLPAAPGAIVVDEATAALIERRFQLSGPRLLFEKGLGEAPRTVLGKETPCLGRERELGRLLGLWEEVRSESVARAILITAPPGGGKSRLRHEFALRVAATGPDFQCLIARGDSRRAGAPFGLLGPALRAAAGLVGGEPPVVQRKRLLAHVTRHVPDAGRVAAFLGEIADVPFPDHLPLLRAARRDPRVMADQTLAAWLDYVEAESRQHPVLLVLEDLDWGDVPSVAFVDAALRTAAQRPVMVLALAHPEVDDRFPGLWSERDLQRLPLAPLSARAARRLVEHIVQGLPPERAAHLVERADGNPFYLEELARALGRGALAESLPETVLGMVQARFDALGADAKRVLRAASVFGQTFRAEGVRALIGDEDHSLERWLDILASKEIVFPRPAADGRELIFRHALLAEAAYAMLAPGDRALGHRLAALHLESAGESEAIVLVDHFEKGGDLARAAALCAPAAEQALDANDLDAAIERARRGARLGATGSTLGSLCMSEARAHFWRGDYRQAELAAELAVAVLEGAAQLRATGELVAALGQQAKFARVATCVAQVLAGPGGAARLDCLVRAAPHLLAGGTHPLAQKVLRELERHQDQLEPASRARLETVRGLVAWQDGRQAEALAVFQSAADAHQALGDARSATEMLTNVAAVLGDLGLLPEALERTRAVLATALRMQLGFLSPILLINICFMEAELGHFAEARAAGARAIALARKQGDPRAEGMTELYLSQGAYLEGRFQDAEQHARAAITLLTSVTPTLPAAHAALAQALLYQGKAEDALEQASRAYHALDESGRVEEGEALIRLVYAECLLGLGQAREGEEVIGQARQRLVARAGTIENLNWRQAFLSRSTSHARTLALARRITRA